MGVVTSHDHNLQLSLYTDNNKGHYNSSVIRYNFHIDSILIQTLYKLEFFDERILTSLKWHSLSDPAFQKNTYITSRA